MSLPVLIRLQAGRNVERLNFLEVGLLWELRKKVEVGREGGKEAGNGGGISQKKCDNFTCAPKSRVSLGKRDAVHDPCPSVATLGRSRLT
jgi:hypothetical protein